MEEILMHIGISAVFSILISPSHPQHLASYLGSVELADNSNLFNVASKTVIEYYNLQLREIAKFAVI